MTISELIIAHLSDRSGSDTFFVTSDGEKRRLAGNESVLVDSEAINNESSLEPTLYKVKTPLGFATVAWYGDSIGFYTDSVEIINKKA
jgi:hypothetical protein